MWSKYSFFNSKSTDESAAANQTHRRLVNKLQNLLAQNQSRFDVFSKQLDANWNAHLQNKRENDKYDCRIFWKIISISRYIYFDYRARMRIPTLENVYQTLEKQHQILMKEKDKINKLKSKVGVRDSSPTKIKYSYSNTDNLYVYLVYSLFIHLVDHFIHIENDLILSVKSILSSIRCFH